MPQDLSENKSAKEPVRLIVAAAGITAVMIAIAAFMPSARLWGLNHLAFIPLPIRVAVIIAIAASFIPSVSRHLYRRVHRYTSSARVKSFQSNIVIITIAIASFAVLFSFRSSTNLLGDGQLIAQSYEAAGEGNQFVVMRSLNVILTEEKIAKGATVLYYYAYKFSVNVLGRSASDGIRIFNCFLGAIVVFLTLWIARSDLVARMLKPWFVILTLFSAAMQLFFGYMENYTPLVFILYIFTMVSFLTIHRRAPLWLPLVLVALMWFVHIQGILFLPTALFVAVWRLAKSKHRANVMRIGSPVLIVLTIIGAVGASMTEAYKSFFLPVLPTDGRFAMLSPSHLLDMLNEVMMMFPLLLVWITIAIATRRSRRNNDNDADPSLKDWFVHRAEFHTVLHMLVPCGVYLMVFNPEIGMARDWDIFMMAACALVPLSLLLVNGLLKRTAISEEQAAAFSVPMWVMTIALGCTWFGVNATPLASAARLESILGYDHTYAAYAYENLAIFYHDRGELKKAVETMETTTSVSSNPRLLVRKALYYNDAGRFDDSVALLQSLLVNTPEYEKARAHLLEMLEKAGRWQEIVAVAGDGTRVHPGEGYYQFFYGEALIHTGRVKEGMIELRKCQGMSLPPAAQAHLERRLAADQ